MIFILDDDSYLAQVIYDELISESYAVVGWVCKLINGKDGSVVQRVLIAGI